MTNIEQLNKRLGEAIGLNPHGEPHYKWFDTNKWEHWMRDIFDWKIERDPKSGLFVRQPVYKKRLMCPALPNRWIIGHWHEPESEFIWSQTHGRDQLWPAKGYYVQTNFWCPEIGQEPTYSDNERFIMLARRHRSMTWQEDTEQMQAAIDYDEKQRDNKISDCLDDLITTHFSVPGIRGGHVSYPSTTKDIKV